MSDAVNISEEEMPILRPIPFDPGQDHRHWRFMEDWYYRVRSGKFKERVIFIKKGTVINGASIPKLFSNVFASTGILFLGACVHDPGYENAGLTFFMGNEYVFLRMSRGELDGLFGKICSTHYPDEAWAISRAEGLLRTFGHGAWEDARKKDGTHIKPAEKSYDEEWNPQYH